MPFDALAEARGLVVSWMLCGRCTVYFFYFLSIFVFLFTMILLFTSFVSYVFFFGFTILPWFTVCCLYIASYCFFFLFFCCTPRIFYGKFLLGFFSGFSFSFLGSLGLQTLMNFG